jgi:hypothetical protein
LAEVFGADFLEAKAGFCFEAYDFGVVEMGGNLDVVEFFKAADFLGLAFDVALILDGDFDL